MKYIFLYIFPLLLFALLNNLASSFNWLLFLLLFAGVLMFQFARLQYPKNRIPPTAKAAQASFFVLTITIILRDRFFDTAIVNGILAFTFLLVIVHFFVSNRQPSA